MPQLNNFQTTSVTTYLCVVWLCIAAAAIAKNASLHISMAFIGHHLIDEFIPQKRNQCSKKGHETKTINAFVRAALCDQMSDWKNGLCKIKRTDLWLFSYSLVPNNPSAKSTIATNTRDLNKCKKTETKTNKQITEWITKKDAQVLFIFINSLHPV